MMTFGIKALADDMRSQMNAGYLRVAVALWIVALGAGGYAESFPNRTTASEMDEIVELGTECFRGVNERCQAAQVSQPFVKTNDAGWYLDKNAMGAIAATIRSLVPYYVNPDTVYNGTTNIVMLTVTGLWASLDLDIGDHTNQFTCTPAGGANAATYGDYPWWIYVENLEERYKVLNALKYRLLGNYAGTSFPEVVQTAAVYGNGDLQAGGYCDIWHGSYSGASLGPADGTEYDITIDMRAVSGAGNADYILFGRGGSYYGFNSDTLVFTLDTSGGTGVTTFSAGLTLDASPDVVKIWNCIIGVDQSISHSISYTASSVDVSSCFNRASSQPIDVYRIFATIVFPFCYCTE